MGNAVRIKDPIAPYAPGGPPVAVPPEGLLTGRQAEVNEKQSEHYRTGRRNNGYNSRGKFYESNGPDVRIRGTASNIAEKYQQLARDAHISGDLVTAEAYQQYAEHYYRLVAE